jgi:hypothetical protein
MRCDSRQDRSPDTARSARGDSRQGSRRAIARFGSLLFLGLVVFSATSHRLARAQVPGSGKIVVSREISLVNLHVPAAGPNPITSIVSREVTLANRHVSDVELLPQSSVVSREVSIATPSADLALVSVDFSPRVARARRPIAVTWRVENSGSGSAPGPWIDRVSISPDERIGNDRLLAEVTRDGPPLAPRAFYEASGVIEAPATPGEYWILVEIGQERRFDDTSPLNDTRFAVVPVRVELGPAPDLVVSDLVGPTDPVIAGSTTSVTFAVTNASPNPTTVPSWFDSIFLTSDTRFADGLFEEPHLVGQFENPTVLLPGESYIQVQNVRVPRRITGRYHIGVYADSRRFGSWRRGSTFDQDETDENNNTRFSPSFEVVVDPVRPDLAPGDFDFAIDAASARRFVVTWNDRNIGSGATETGNWRDEVWLSRTRGVSIDADDLLLGMVFRSGDPAQPGPGTRLSVSTVLPADASGEYWVKIACDIDDAVWELGLEGNNVAVSALPVAVNLSPAVDLAPIRARAPSEAHPGHEIEVSFDVDSIGAPPLDLHYSWVDALWLSRDDRFDRSMDLRLGGFPHSTSVLPTGRLALDSYAKTVRTRIPNHATAGAYRVLVVADEEDRVFEGFDDPGPQDDALEERNNVAASSPIEITLLSADLSIELGFAGGAPLPTSGAPGETRRIEFRVTNVGSLATPVESWSDSVHLSRDTTFGFDDVRLGTFQRRGALEPRGSYISNIEFVVPFVSAGPWFLVAAVDSTEFVFELDPGGDNDVATRPFTVSADAADLVVRAVRAPAAALAGSTISVDWDVANDGTRVTNRSLWIDRIFLSADEALDPSDALIGERSQGTALAAGQSYTTGASFSLPLAANGAYRVIVVTDARGDIFEADDANNARAASSALDIEKLRAPNLVVEDVRVEGTIVSGQIARVSWRIRNTGDGPTLSSEWIDSVFLSPVRVLDPRSDTFLGAVERVGALAPGESYDASGIFDVPLGIGGAIWVFVATDRGVSNFEEGRVEDNSADAPVVVTIPPRADIEVTRVVPAASALLGDLFDVAWTITNRGRVTIAGRWFDGIFLSDDDRFDFDDVFAGSFESALAEPLAPGESAEFHARVSAAGLRPGRWHVIVRADVRDQIPDDASANDLAASTSRVDIVARSIPLDAPPITASLGPGDERWFELETPAGETVRVELDHESTTASTELWARFDDVPSPGVFDARSEDIDEADPSLTIPTTRAGKYFILVRAVHGAAGGPSTDATLRARTIPFSIERVVPPRIGDRGRVTLLIDGSQFDVESRVELEGGIVRAARRVERIDATRLRATFSVDDLPHGPKTVSVIRADGRRVSLVDALVVESVVPPIVELEQPDPPALREGASAGTLDVVVVQRGNVDAEYVFVLANFEQRGGRELVHVGGSSPYTEHAVRRGFETSATIVRSLAPFDTARLSVTARAASEPTGDIPIGFGLAFATTDVFLDLVSEAAESARVTVLAHADSIPDERRAEVLAAARDPVQWQARAFEALVAAGLLDAADATVRQPGRELTPGRARCSPREQLGRTSPGYCADLSTLAMNEWYSRLVDFELDAIAAVAVRYEATVPTRGAGVLLDVVSCGFCGFWPVKKAIDPNEKTGSEGTGGEDYVPKKRDILYRIEFENVSTASSPAAVVRIVDPLHPAFNAGSFRVGNIAFGDTLIEVPPGQIYYQNRMPLEPGSDLVLDLVAGVNAARNEAFWTLRTIDRSTGLSPTDANRGFLPPEDGTGRGRGWVEFSVRPSPAVTGRIVVDNEASITFDANEPISTSVVSHTLEADPPFSLISSLPEQFDGVRLMLEWTGDDVVGGSGLASYTIWMSEGDGPFVPVLDRTPATSAEIAVRAGQRYRFYSTAVDHAGNVEDAPDEPDAATIIIGDGESARFRRGDVDGSGVVNITDPIRLLGFLFLGGTTLPCADAADANDREGLNLTDAVILLHYLFLGGASPSSPGPLVCGVDVAADALSVCEPSADCP